MTLVEFLTARLDEEHAAAQAAYDEATDYQLLGSEATEIHFSHWKPDRVLADVDAKRRLIRECVHYIHGYQDEPDGTADLLGQITLELLALSHTEHPDYRKEWKP